MALEPAWNVKRKEVERETGFEAATSTLARSFQVLILLSQALGLVGRHLGMWRKNVQLDVQVETGDELRFRALSLLVPGLQVQRNTSRVGIGHNTLMYECLCAIWEAHFVPGPLPS